MKHKERLLAMRLSYDYLCLMLEQCESPCADGDTEEAKDEVAILLYKLSCSHGLNGPQRELLQTLIDSYLEGEVQHFEHDLAQSVLKSM